MKKTEFQLNGNLYRRNPDGATWANRYISLSTDTGTMKFYVEKSGKRTLKGQVNIKQGRLEELDQTTAGRAFAFAIINESLGTSEDANIALAALSEAQYTEWKESISLCFTIGSTRRRKSLLAADLADMGKETVESKKEESAPPVLPTVETVTPNKQPVVEEKSTASSSSVFFPKDPATEEPAEDISPKYLIETKRPSIALAFPSVLQDSPLDPPSTITKESSLLSPPPTFDSERTPSVKFTGQAELGEEVTARGPVMDAFRRTSLKSFKAPSFKNILSPKEPRRQEEEEEEEIRATESEKQEKEGEMPPDFSESGQKKHHPIPGYNPMELKLTNRPTELTRMGYLYKLDTVSKDVGEDSWINQYVTLNVATGILEYFAEIAGRRIQRGKIDINEASIKTIDYVYYGRLFVFKVILNSAVNKSYNQQQESIIFSAEEMESLSYWLVSFQDCKEFKEKLTLNEACPAGAAEGKAAEPGGEEAVVRLLEHRTSFTPFSHKNLSIITDENAMNAVSPGDSSVGDTSNKNTIEPSRTRNSMNTSSKNLLKEELENKLQLQLQHGISNEYPSPFIQRKPSFHTNDAGSSAGDLERVTLQRIPSNRTNLLRGESTKSFIENVTQVNETNLDDLFKSQGGLSRVNSLAAGGDADGKVVGSIQVKLKSVTFPADKLARRIKIWYSSSGFALTNEVEIEAFVKTLKEADDPILRSFAEEKFDQIKDWATLLDLLKKYEHKALVEAKKAGKEVPLMGDPITLHAEATLPERSNNVSKVALNEKFDLPAVSNQFAKDLNVSELALLDKLPHLLCSSENHIWGQGLKSIQEDMTFAEDLMLYQEDVIRQLIEDQTALKVVVNGKDELINQLYRQISELQESRNAAQVADGGFTPLFSSSIALNRTLANSSPAPKTATSQASLGTNNVFTNSQVQTNTLSRLPRTTHELYAIADREFNVADKDGDGKISREEWRTWIQDKHNLLSEHNHVKTILMSEIRNLRKALNPNTEEIYAEIKKTEENRKAMEEELVKLYIERDNVKGELNELQGKCQEMEMEKTMMESDWEERYNSLLNNLGAKGTSSTNANRSLSNPYAYNYDEDKALGLDTKQFSPLQDPLRKPSHSGDSAVPPRPETPNYQNLDLMNLANMNLTTLGGNEGPPISNVNPNTQMIYIPAGDGTSTITGNPFAYHSSTEEKRRDSPYTILTTTNASHDGTPSFSNMAKYHVHPDHIVGKEVPQQIAAPAPYMTSFGDHGQNMSDMYWMAYQQGGLQENHPLRAALKYDIQARQAAPLPGASAFTGVLVKKVLKDKLRSTRPDMMDMRSPTGRGRSPSPPRSSSPQRFMQTTNSWAKKSHNPVDKKDKDVESVKDMASGAVNWKYNLRNMKWG